MDRTIIDAYAELPALQALLLSTLNWTNTTVILYDEIQDRFQRVNSEIRLPLLQVLIAIAFIRGHIHILKDLVTNDSPAETIFDILDASKITSREYDLDAWTIVLNSNWLHRPDAQWRWPGWQNILTMYMDDVSEDNATKYTHFATTLKKHGIKQEINTVAQIAEFGQSDRMEKLALLFSIFPARSLGRERNSLLRIVARQHRAAKIPAIRVLLAAGLNPNWIGPKHKYVAPNGPIDRGDHFPSEWFGKTERETALHVAAEQGDLEMARLLLENGARKWVRDGLGKTAKQRAEKHGHPEMMKLLRLCGLF